MKNTVTDICSVTVLFLKPIWIYATSTMWVAKQV